MKSKIFRLQDNVPQVYVDKSRDFQLFCRLYDCLFGAVKYDVDTIANVIDANRASDTVLGLLCSRVGFFPKKRYDSNVLKYIIASFPLIIKNKGNRRGIEYAVNAILKAENSPKAIGTPYIEIYGKQSDADVPSYTIHIYTSVELYNKYALDDVLSYILPTGYDYVVEPYAIDGDKQGETNIVYKHDDHEVEKESNLSIQNSSIVYGSKQAGESLSKYVGRYDTSQITGSSNYLTEQQGNDDNE